VADHLCLHRHLADSAGIRWVEGSPRIQRADPGRSGVAGSKSRDPCIILTISNLARAGKSRTWPSSQRGMVCARRLMSYPTLRGSP
jgi:hypothetical protein